MVKEYKLHEFLGRHVVLTPTRKASDMHPEANFDDTGWALCGRLLRGETIPDFARRAEAAHERHDAENTDEEIARIRRKIKIDERVMNCLKEDEICNHP